MGEKKASVWTPANVVTSARIALMPVWLLVAEYARTSGALGSGSLVAWASLVLYAFISLTDKLDGYLARSRNEITDFGKFLDPIADKLAVVCALLYLIELNVLPTWAALVIVAREFLVSGLRMVVASKGVVVAASELGKWKTATTMIAICALLLCVTIPALGPASAIRWFGFACMLVALVLTAWSGIDYFVKCWPHVAGA